MCFNEVLEKLFKKFGVKEDDSFARLCVMELVFNIVIHKGNGYMEKLGGMQTEDFRRKCFGSYFGTLEEGILSLAGSWFNDLCLLLGERYPDVQLGSIYSDISGVLDEWVNSSESVDKLFDAGILDALVDKSLDDKLDKLGDKMSKKLVNSKDINKLIDDTVESTVNKLLSELE